MAKRIVFPKNLFERVESMDFSDDGTRFRGYKYKNTVPITYTRFDNEVFCSIRFDYRMPYEHYCKSGIDYDKFNGTLADKFNMNEFINICEQAFNFINNYNSPESAKKRITEKIFELDEKITHLIDTKNGYINKLNKLLN